MAIYRGTGGSSTTNTVDEVTVNTVTLKATEAATSASEAASSASSAATSAASATSSAASANTNASQAITAASSASTSSTNAASSASAAATSETNAAASETAAASSATSAAASATTATTKASEASTSATNAAASETASASSASAASTSATSAATSATTATTKASEAATSAANAATSETNAATSETNAATSATNASNSATAAAGSATAAAASETAAATSETNASNSATAAASSATSASTSATTATTKASEASTSAANAATSATNAAASESAAASSQTAAEAAKDAALSALDSFDDRYLGSKATEPTLDNDGNALVSGALYFNTTTEEMKVYSGSQWLNAYASLSGALLSTNNLSDLNNAATARTNLGLGTAATTASTDYATAAQGTNADTAYGWGNHASAGYITDYTVTQGDVTTHEAALTIAQSQVTGLSTALAGKVDDSQVLTNVPSGAVFTDTTYSVGNGGLTEINFTSARSSKLDGIEAGAEVNVPTNLGSGTTSTYVSIVSSTGSGTTVPAATTTTAGTLTAADKTKLDGIATNANNYTHPSYAGDDINLDTGALSGATVISDLDFNITTDTQGHVTDANATYSTRNLTAANIGAQPAGTYNTIIGTDSDINTSGSTIIDNIYVTDGVITSMGTRTLTLADLGFTGETNATADQSASEILTLLKTVDGSGSGLDADLLDGIGSGSFVRSDANDTKTGYLDVNNTVYAYRGVGDTHTDTSQSGTQTPDFSRYQNFVWTLTGNVTLGNAGDEVVGQSGVFVFIHSGGARTVSLSSDYESVGGAGLTLSGAAGATDIVPYFVAATNRIILGTPQLAFS